MVLLHVKGIEKFYEFLFECSTKDNVDEITTEIIKIHNLRVTLNVLCKETEELIKYGPARNAELKGLSAKIIKETVSDLKMDEDDIENCNFDLDPTARRIGKPIKNENVIKTLNELVSKIRNYTKIEKVALRKKGGLTKLNELEELKKELSGGIMIAFPMKLPLYDIIQQILFEHISIDIADINYKKEIHDAKTGQLWFGAKKLSRSDELNKYIGNNEKTKIIVKITKQKSNMPLREPAVDEESRKKMMAMWYKKQETDKELKEDDDTSYLQSHWANDNALKQSYLGMDKNLQYR